MRQTIKRFLISGFVVVAITGIGFGQKRGPVKGTSSQIPKDTILYEVTRNLSTPEICGDPDWAVREVVSGAVVKRIFDDSEMWLSGIVIKDARDRRRYINFDTEHIAGLASSASGDLADYLLVGVKIKVEVFRCRKILYAAKITPL